MKIVTQVGIIFSICWISQIIEKLLPFSFPASVIGMILLFILLCVHILKVDHIREKSDFLLENMAFFIFITEKERFYNLRKKILLIQIMTF